MKRLKFYIMKYTLKKLNQVKRFSLHSCSFGKPLGLVRSVVALANQGNYFSCFGFGLGPAKFDFISSSQFGRRILYKSGGVKQGF